MQSDEKNAHPAASAAPVPSYEKAWDALSAAKEGPLQRLDRLQSILMVISLALRGEHHQSLDTLEIQQIGTVAQFAYEESSHVGGDLERFLMGWK